MKLNGQTLYQYAKKRTYAGNYVWKPTKKIKGQWFPQRIVKLLQRSVNAIEWMSEEPSRNQLRYTQAEKEVREIAKELKKLGK